MTWWVPDDATAAALQEALAAQWPEGDDAVQVGPPAGDGFEIAGGALVWRHDGDVRAAPVDGDVTSWVLLARSWSHPVADVGGTWVPEPMAPPAPVHTVERAVSPPQRPGLALGLGLRDGWSEPGLGGGPTIAVRIDDGVLGAEVDAYAAVGVPRRYARYWGGSGTTDFPVDRASLRIAADVGPKLVHGAFSPRLVVGAEAASAVQVEYERFVGQIVGTGRRMSLVGGGAVDVTKDRVTLRTSLLVDQPEWGSLPMDQGLPLSRSVLVGLDARVRL